MDAPQASAWGFVARNPCSALFTIIAQAPYFSDGESSRRTRRAAGTRAGAQTSARRKPGRDPAKHSKKDPARPTRAKASRPDLPPTDPALAELLNPGIGQGTAGPGSQTGLKPPADDSFDRRADFGRARRARRVDRVRRGTAGGLWSPHPRTRRRRAWTPSSRRRSVSRATMRPARAPTRTQSRPSAGSPAPPPRCRRWRRCCARAARNSASGRGRPHRPPRPEKSEGGRPLVIQSDFEPKGDQPTAIAGPGGRRRAPGSHPVLLGVTGSGKTFTMAEVIEATQRPALVLAPTRRWRPSSTASSKASSRTTRSNISSAISATTSPRPTCSRRTCIEKNLDQRPDRPHVHSATRALRSSATTSSSGVGVASRHRLGRDATSAMTFTPEGERIGSATSSPIWWRCSTSAAPATSIAARSACAATWSDSAPTKSRAWRVLLFGDEIEAIHEIDRSPGRRPTAR